MGNIANSTIYFNDFILSKHRARIEHKRIQSLIPYYFSRLSHNDSTVTSLNLNGLGVDCSILQLLSPLLLRDGTRVQEMYLENNWIESEGATCIARILSKDKHLKIVSLANNPLGSMGVIALASALEQNDTLEKLNLSHCNIDDSGVYKLAQSLKRSNNTLKYLNLEGNPISSEGVRCLLKCVYDTSDGIRSLWECNHTIRAFQGKMSLYSSSFPQTEANRQLMQKLGEILTICNRRSYSSVEYRRLIPRSSKTIAASRKILRYYFRDEPFEYMSTLDNTDEKMLPYLIEWLGRYGDLGIVYDVLRDRPWLLDHMRDDGGNECADVDMTDYNRYNMESNHDLGDEPK